MKYIINTLVVLILSCSIAWAQFPPDLLPMSRGETNDSLAALRLALTTKADTLALNALIARFVADSTAKANLINTLDSRVDADSARLDSLILISVPAADTTSPGLFYALNDSGYAYQADTLVTTIAVGVAIDTVAPGDTVRLQTSGSLSFSWWNLSPGAWMVSDSITAGRMSPTDSLRSNTKKMQPYGRALNATTLRLNIGEVWIWQE